MMRRGRPVAMKIFTPRCLAAVRASMVEAGIRCVRKLTSVPSMSKNNDFTNVIPALITIRKVTEILLYRQMWRAAFPFVDLIPYLRR